MATDQEIAIQNAQRNDFLPVQRQKHESLWGWMEAYFAVEVTTSESSQAVQRRDIKRLIDFIILVTDTDKASTWTPRQTQAFRSALQKEVTEDGKRQYSDRTINRILAHIKTFASWIHKHQPFPLGNPGEKVRMLQTTSLLDIERAITDNERRNILDAADMLIRMDGISKDRNRYHDPSNRPRRKSARPYRDRAIIYTLIETGMRRAAITDINGDSVTFKNLTVSTIEKGGHQHEYLISDEGMSAIQDYIGKERTLDAERFTRSLALFLPAKDRANSCGKLHPSQINRIWNKVCQIAGVQGKTPHSARHAMGKHLIEKTRNLATVQRQLGHKNPAYSMQYTRVTHDELKDVLNQRD